MSRAGMSAQEQLDNRPLTKNQKSLILLVVLGNLAEFFDMFVVGFIIAILAREWSLSGSQSGIILACAGLGTVMGAITWGSFADRWGRRRAFIWCVYIFTFFTFVCLFVSEQGWFGVPGWLVFAVLRVLVGFGVGGLNITSIPYVQEFVPTRQRGFLAGLGSVFIPAGLLLGSLASKMVGDNWHVLILLGALPVVLVLWAYRVPESPRYCVAKGNKTAARDAYAWALNVPREQVGSLPEVVQRDRRALGTVLREHKKPLMLVSIGSFMFMMGSFTIQSWGQSLLGSFFGFSVGTVAWLFMIVSVADVAGRLLSAFLADRWGRRYTLCLFGCLGALGCLVAAFNGGSGVVFFVGVLLAMAFGDGAFGILNAFGGEQFPTQVRSTGLGLAYGLGAVSKVIGPSMMGALIGASQVSDADPVRVSWAFVIFALCLVVGAVTYLFARETKGVVLRENV